MKNRKQVSMADLEKERMQLSGDIKVKAAALAKLISQAKEIGLDVEVSTEHNNSASCIESRDVLWVEIYRTTMY